MEDFTGFICYIMKGTMRKVEKHFALLFEGYGINLAQSYILFSLLEKDGLTLTEVGNRTQIENSSLTTMADRLERDELVRRGLDPQDRRVVRLFITEKGQDLAQRVLEDGASFNRLLKANLGETEEVFMEGLARISNGLGQTIKP